MNVVIGPFIFVFNSAKFKNLSLKTKRAAPNFIEPPMNHPHNIHPSKEWSILPLPFYDPLLKRVVETFFESWTTTIVDEATLIPKSTLTQIFAELSKP